MVVCDLSETGVLLAAADRWWRFTPTTSILTPFGLRNPTENQCGQSAPDLRTLSAWQMLIRLGKRPFHAQPAGNAASIL